MKRLIILFLLLCVCFFASCEYAELIDTSILEGKPETVTVTFDSNGGSQVESAVTTLGYPVKRPKNPTKENLCFDGWYTEDGEKWLFTKNAVKFDMTLVAKWVPFYTVTFESSQGTCPEPQSIGSGRLAVEPEATASGYYFEGWYFGGKLWDFESDTVSRSITLTAKWSKLTVVSFDSQMEGVSVPDVMIMPNSAIGELPCAYTEGSTLIGWYQNIDHSLVPVTSDTVFSEDTTLYAKWKLDSSVLLITLNPAQGKMISTKTRLNCKIGEKIGELPVPFSPSNGYFLGWYDENGTKYLSTSRLTESISLTAKYQFIEKCTVNENGTHRFTRWYYELSAPTCTEDVFGERHCLDCQYKEIYIIEEATGHSYSNKWSYDLLSKSRQCYECDHTQLIEFKNLNDYVGSIVVEGEIYGEKNLNCLINGSWDETDKTTFCGKSNGEIDVIIPLTDSVSAEYIYVKGSGSLTFTVLVRYQGESGYKQIGIGGFGAEPQKIEIKGTITSIILHTDNGGDGLDYWQEILLAGY